MDSLLLGVLFSLRKAKREDPTPPTMMRRISSVPATRAVSLAAPLATVESHRSFFFHPGQQGQGFQGVNFGQPGQRRGPQAQARQARKEEGGEHPHPLQSLFQMMQEGAPQAAKPPQHPFMRHNPVQQQRQQAAQELASTEFELVQSAIALIQQLVQENWSRPPSARNGMRAILQIRLLPTGELVSASITESSGDVAFDRSAENAVYRAAPFRELQTLPINLFNRNFRILSLIFQPEDLLF